MKISKSLRRSIFLGLGIIVVLVVYAYGFDVVQVDLEEFRKPQRQESRVRVTRALAHPEIFEFDQEEVKITAPIWIPCTSVPAEVPEPDTSGAYMVLTPNCGNPDQFIDVEGLRSLCDGLLSIPMVMVIFKSG
jgi:hypothetical protein